MKRKTLLGLAGTFKGDFIVTDGKTTHKVKGQSSSGNIKQNIDTVISNARKDAHVRFWHVHKKTGLSSQLIDWIIDYSISEKFFRVKRINRKGKYYTYTFNRSNGRIVSVKRWSSKTQL